MLFSCEELRDCGEEIRALSEKHHLEISLFQDILPNPNIRLYEAMAACGALKIFTVRDDRRLIGYATFFISFHPHFMHSKQAVNDMLFISEEHRGGGYQFMKYCDEQLKDCQLVYWTVTTRCDFSHLMKRLGAEEAETRYVKRNF